MRESIAKLRNIVMHPNITYMYYNVYLTKKVYFGYKIIELNDKQDELLCKIYKSTIGIKLRLGATFPRVILHIRQNALEVGLNKLKTAVAMLAKKIIYR